MLVAAQNSTQLGSHFQSNVPQYHARSHRSGAQGYTGILVYVRETRYFEHLKIVKEIIPDQSRYSYEKTLVLTFRMCSKIKIAHLLQL